MNWGDCTSSNACSLAYQGWWHIGLKLLSNAAQHHFNMRNNMIKILLTILVLLISSSAYSVEKSVCDGVFESGQAAHVTIDWDNKIVSINKINTYIQSVTSYGIITGNYKNKLNIDTFSIIGHYQNAGTFITQQQVQYGQITLTNFARLFCSKSFYKPFTDRMLGN